MALLTCFWQGFGADFPLHIQKADSEILVVRFLYMEQGLRLVYSHVSRSPLRSLHLIRDSEILVVRFLYMEQGLRHVHSQGSRNPLRFTHC